MQSAGFRELDFQIDREIFGRSSVVVPRYSADRKAAEQVVRRVRDLYPDWVYELAEDQWGYTASWRCPGGPVGASALVLLGQHRASTLTVAIARASLLSVRSMRSYEERRQRRAGVPQPRPEAPAREGSR